MTYLLAKLASRIPLPLWYPTGWLIYFVAWHLLRWHRARSARNLGRAFPEKPEAERHEILRLCYRHLGDMLVEGIWGYSASAEQLRRRVVFENPELVQHCAAHGKSVVVLAAHMCNWEWMLMSAGAELGIPIDAIYRPLSVAGVDRLMREGRSRFGGNPIADKDLLMALLQRASQARAYAMVADQTPARNAPKHWTRFLGQDTAFFLGPEKIAQFLDAPVMFVAMRRLRRGYYAVRFHVIAEPPYDRDLGVDIAERFARLLEAEIRAHPSDWLWVHNRWKYSRESDAGPERAPGKRGRARAPEAPA